MRVEWDPRKAALNVRNHGVRFADVLHVLYDEYALTIVDDLASEERFVSLGRDALDRVLVVVWAVTTSDGIRINSARKATGRERRQYRGKP